MQAFVAVGGNVGEPAEIATRFRSAAAAIGKLDYVIFVNRSRTYRSKPVGPVGDQPTYINAVLEVELRDTVTASSFLEDLQAVEAAHGRDRDREIPFGPRTLDLDLLLFGDLELHEQSPLALTVPHPRLHQRAFVLQPLAELAGAELIVPGLGASLRECLDTPAVRAQLLHLELFAADESA